MAKRHGVEFWREHLDAWHRSDLTQKAYCANHGLGEKAFYRWHRKEKEAIAAAKPSLTLVPVSVGTPTTGNIVKLRSPCGWEIEMPGSSTSLLIDFLKRVS